MLWSTQDFGYEDSDEEQPALLGLGTRGRGGRSGSSAKKRLPLCSMDVLSSWYRESFETMSRHVRAYSPAGTQGIDSDAFITTVPNTRSTYMYI